jgi:hypothetical protein
MYADLEAILSKDASDAVPFSGDMEDGVLEDGVHGGIVNGALMHGVRR